VINIEQINPEKTGKKPARRIKRGIMAVRKGGRSEEYLRYGKHCLELVRIATSRQSRVIQREMAAEWLKLADMLSAAEQPAE